MEIIISTSSIIDTNIEQNTTWISVNFCCSCHHVALCSDGYMAFSPQAGVTLSGNPSYSSVSSQHLALPPARNPQTENGWVGECVSEGVNE